MSGLGGRDLCPRGSLNHFYGVFLPGFLWLIILVCLAHSPYFLYLRILPCALEATQWAPRDPRPGSRGERSPLLPLEARPDSPGESGVQSRDPCLPLSQAMQEKKALSSEDGGVSGVSSSCGARGGFLPRHDEDLREPLVWRQESSSHVWK